MINQFLKFVYLRVNNSQIYYLCKYMPVSIVESSSSLLNRTESSHSNNVRPASNMIPCFPANNSTDAQHCDIVSSRSSPSHFTKDMILLLILPKSEPGQLSYKKIKPLFGKSKRILFEKIEIRGNAHAAIHLRTINQFLKLVYLRKIYKANIS